MTGLLKQSTSATIVLGPFVDDADGKTAESGLTISQADVRLSKNGGSYAQKNDATSCTHLESGNYACPLNTTDTNTLGHLRVSVHESGALPVWRDFMVVAANIYDSLIGNSDKLQIDVNQWNNSNVATPDTAGYPKVTLKSGTGTGEINLSGGNLAGSVGSLGAQAKTDVNAEVVDALSVDTYAEPGSVPAATSSIKDKVGWLFMLARNKRLTTATTDKVRNDADAADVGTAALNDDGTTFSRGEYS